MVDEFSRSRPILGITMGDPAGIGPEIAVKALEEKYVYEICRPLIVGEYKVIRNIVEFALKLPLKVHPVYDVKEAIFEFGTIDVFDINCMDSLLQQGKVSTEAGNAAFLSVKKVIELAMENRIDATITGPLNKEALNLAGHHYSGHTEIYADFTGTRDYSMMLAHQNLRVVHVSTHVSLREACDRVKKDRVLKVIQLGYDACCKIGIGNPRIGVAGLNPHSGENGLFGREEIDEILPAITEAKSMGMNVEGPVPPDTLYARANGGQFDICVAMYHDQGHIPLKVLGFTWDSQLNKWNSVSGVNITLGLPIIRSSVDHGTAFDIAGKGIASPDSILNAIEYGIKLSKNR